MSNDFSDMEDYSNVTTSVSFCKGKGCSDSTIASCCGCPDYFEELKKEKSECKRNSNCPRHNIFEGMSDEEIKNLFNKEELKEKSSESNTNHSDYIDYLKMRCPGLFNLKTFKKLINDFGDLPDDIVPLPYEDFLGYNPTEYPELDKALKNAKDMLTIRTTR